MIDFNNIEKYRENNRIEAKRALGGLPKSIWETYSAFANTLGGFILLGVEEEKDYSFHPVDLPDPEGMKKEFLGLVGRAETVSINLLSEDDVMTLEAEGKHIIAIRIPRAEKKDMPVFIEGDPMNAYIRKGEGDYKCGPEEYQALLAMKKEGQKEAVIDYLTDNPGGSAEDIATLIGADDDYARALINSLIDEKMIEGFGESPDRIYKLRR